MKTVQHIKTLPKTHGRAAVVVPDNLPPPDVIAQEIVDDLEAALEQFRLIANDLGPAVDAA